MLAPPVARTPTTAAGNWASESARRVLLSVVRWARGPAESGMGGEYGLARSALRTALDFRTTPVFPPETQHGDQPGSPVPAPTLIDETQPKLAIGPVDDPLEREADTIAEQVMRTPAPALTVTSAPLQTSRKCAACDQEEQASSHPASAARMLQAQGAPSSTPGSAATTSATQAPGVQQNQIAQADALRQSILQKAQVSVRQLQIACDKQAAPDQLIAALPDQARAFSAWLGIGPDNADFCSEVALVLSDISKNLNMTLPPPYFPTPQEMADPNELCNVGNQFAVADYENTQVRICPRLLGSQFTEVQRALILTHELFHEPSFGMSHATLDVMNTSHCGLGATDEAVGNPYCVTNVIGDLGAGEVF
ncbi:hypothetical protein IQ288_31530 [Burkholderia sp. R-69980]|nr:hypothetical protein [Burkholderia sp. R-69980]